MSLNEFFFLFSKSQVFKINKISIPLDSFEVGNNKKALHETEKVLKKQPNLRCARALKGLALMRLGKNEESNAIINQIVSEKPNDDATLQVLSYIYKEIEECTYAKHPLNSDSRQSNCGY